MDNPVLNKNEILAFLAHHKPLLAQQFGVKKIALFGSYARDEASQESDIDLLIEVTSKNFDQRFYLKEYLENHFNKKIDLGYFDSVRPFIKRSIEKELIYA